MAAKRQAWALPWLLTGCWWPAMPAARNSWQVSASCCWVTRAALAPPRAPPRHQIHPWPAGRVLHALSHLLSLLLGAVTKAAAELQCSWLQAYVAAAARHLWPCDRQQIKQRACLQAAKAVWRCLPVLYLLALLTTACGASPKRWNDCLWPAVCQWFNTVWQNCKLPVVMARCCFATEKIHSQSVTLCCVFKYLQRADLLRAAAADFRCWAGEQTGAALTRAFLPDSASPRCQGA